MDPQMRKHFHGTVREEIQTGFLRSRELNSLDIFYLPRATYLFCVIFFQMLRNIILENNFVISIRRWLSETYTNVCPLSNETFYCVFKAATLLVCMVVKPALYINTYLVILAIVFIFIYVNREGNLIFFNLFIHPF